MDRNHEFTVGLPDGGQYEVALLSEVETVSQNGSTVLRLPWIGVDAKGDSEEEVLPQLLGGLQEKIGAGPGSPDFERFAEYVRSKGRRLSDEEVAGREEKRFKSQTLRSILTPDEHYEVQLFADAEVDRAGDRVTVRLPWIDVEGSGATLQEAGSVLLEEFNKQTGEADQPGPKFNAYAAWVRERGTAIPEEQLRAEREQEEAYTASKGKLEPIGPDEIPKASSDDVPLLVDFWAEWCAPCRAITPVLAQLSDEWSGRMRFRKLNVDDFDGVWERFGFRGIPTMIVFRNGEEVHRVTGFGGKDALVKELEPLLS